MSQCCGARFEQLTRAYQRFLSVRDGTLLPSKGVTLMPLEFSGALGGGKQKRKKKKYTRKKKKYTRKKKKYTRKKKKL